MNKKYLEWLNKRHVANSQLDYCESVALINKVKQIFDANINNTSTHSTNSKRIK